MDSLLIYLCMLMIIKIYTNDNDIQKPAQTLRRRTEAVSQWYKENLLQANPQKYQIVTIDPLDRLVQ